MDVVKLLLSKNRCLDRVLQLTTEFLKKNDLDLLEEFQSKRAVIFKAIDLHDRKIRDALALLPKSKTDSAMAALVQETLDQKDRIIHSLLEKDDILIERIEAKKKQVLDELASTRKSNDLIGKFKSNWVAAGGEELDRKL